ncbi:MAG TPA: DNA internalization-related competence protein ComEC/Rec2 [Gemmatimonadaceae bacterium]|nr:DNA internalization-related competence protein ComEC/Rec2 [Gemmatimonadaceae bacterium]
MAAALIAVTSPTSPRNADFSQKSSQDFLARARLRAGRSIDRTFGDDSPLARALLIADQRQIPTEMRDRYAAAGIIHMLSISGLHVAVIAAAVELLFQVARLSRRASLIGAFGITAVYVAVIGAPPPALRSATMLGVAILSRLGQRPTSIWASWALGAFVPLIDPRTALDVGYQLSVLGMCALVAAGRLWKRVFADRLDGVKAKLARELLTSIVACAITAPLVAWAFGRVSLIAPLANLVAAPVITLAQPILFLALLTAPIPALATFFAQAVHPLLLAFDWISFSAASTPFAAITVGTTPVAALLAATSAVCLIWACASRHPTFPAFTGLGALALMSVLPFLPIHRDRRVELDVLDVGQGDAILLRTDSGRWAIFDAGPAWRGGDAGRSNIMPFILRRGGSVDAFILSHPHTDHVGGAASVINALQPRVYWDAAFAGGSEAYSASLLAARQHNVEWRRVHPGESFQLDGVTVSFLAPDSAWTERLKDPNLSSTIALVRYGSVRFLLVGDAEREEEDWLLAHFADSLHADVLKVGHHGSSTSSSDAFLQAVHPALAVISVGAENKYGHPNEDVLHALSRIGADILRTDQLGTITIRTDGQRIEVETQTDKWKLAR